jgi:phage terminase large subunit-like protein
MGLRGIGSGPTMRVEVRERERIRREQEQLDLPAWSKGGWTEPAKPKRGRPVGSKKDVEKQAIAEEFKHREKAGWTAKDLTRSERVIAFCEELRVTSGPDAGKLLKLRDWQREFVERLYRVDDKGVRQVRTAILSMGRKNGKTQLAAALALCHLLGPEAEQRGEVYSCANDRFQASKIFSEMVALIMGNPELADRVNIIRFRKEIEDLKSGSVYVALSAEVKTKLGLNPSCIIYDELGSSPDRHLYDALDSALGGRKEPLLLVISTQAADDLAPMSRLIDYGIKVNEGEIVDPTFHLTLHQAPADMDPWSLEAWKAANPALGDFRSLPDVERLALQAQRMPSTENSFRNLILNQRVSAHSKFIERSDWNACAEAPEIPDGARIYIGLDLGATRDMSALVVIHQDIDGVFHVKPEFWLPGDISERSDQDHAPYDLWVREGLITPAGKTTDPKLVALRVAELSRDYRVMTVGFDRWRINDFKRELDEIGCDVQLVEHGQGYRDMSPAVNIVERLVLQRRVRHGGNPVLATCVANAVITRDPAGGRKLDKAKSTGRIDGLVALAMAFSLALVKNEQEIDIRAMIG